MDLRLANKHILLGVTGSIAIYKSCDILRSLKKEGADIRVVMTMAAQRFVSALTFETLSCHEVVTELFPKYRVIKTRHIGLAEWADCILICPATANIVGKIASGIADDFLTTVVMASRAPVVFAPAMDYQMIQNPIYLSNCEKLKKQGYSFVSTEEGELASGAKGPGRLAGKQQIMACVRKVLLGNNQLKGIKVLVTAGPTHEALDPVRYITNHSTGKMGFALAEEAALRGADVTLITGPTDLHMNDSFHTIRVQNADEMTNAVLSKWPDHKIMIMAAAVADYRPRIQAKQKMKKSKEKLMLDLVRTEDILLKVSKNKGKRIIIGFALETDNGVVNAREKLETKNMDLIVLNNPLDEGAGFGSDTNKVVLIERGGKPEALPLIPKWQVARHVLDRINKLNKGKF